MDDADENKLVRAVKQVKIEELRAKVGEAALTNELRSGERGKQAQNSLLELEAKCAFFVVKRAFVITRAGCK